MYDRYVNRGYSWSGMKADFQGTADLTVDIDGM